MRIWLVTTFPNSAWDVYARTCLQSIGEHLPEAIKICVGLDDDALEGPVRQILDKHVKDGQSTHDHRFFEIMCGWKPEHQGFVAQFKNRDHPAEYRLQATRFCHKIFVLKAFMDKAVSLPDTSRPTHIIWWDADAHINRAVSSEEIEALLPTGNEAVSYLGRRDWDHSECGFMGFNMAPGAGGKGIIDFMTMYYTQGLVFSLPQWHDSYLFDVARRGENCRNLSENVPGNNVWAATTLGDFSEHWKGQEAKQRQKPMSDAELLGCNKPV